MRWLSIEARFIGGRYHGRTRDGQEAQWPPNPHRVLQALIAAGNVGHRRLEFSEAKKAALRWLAEREPPEILAPAAVQASALRLYVPNNDMDKVASAWAKRKPPEKSAPELRTGKDLRPHAFDPSVPVMFLWPVLDEEWEAVRAHAELLCAEARFLHSLGLGVDLVVGNGRLLDDAEKRGLGGDAYVAIASGSGWRVPVAGATDELLDRYGAATQGSQVSGARGRRSLAVVPPSPPAMVNDVAYVPRARTRRRQVYAFALAGNDGEYRSFDPLDALLVSAWLRHAAHRRARDLGFDSAFTEGFVCGHAEDTRARSWRLSYVPLPSIPAEGRDGRIRRALLVEPFGDEDDRAGTLARRLAGRSLVEDGTGEWKAELRPVAASLYDRTFERYVAFSSRWASVTPVVLPGHDDRRAGKAHALVLKALAQAGYTTPVTEVHLQSIPVFPGAEPAGRYRVPEYLKAFPRQHVIVTFREPVAGPVLIGAGRHVGLGVCAPLR